MKIGTLVNLLAGSALVAAAQKSTPYDHKYGSWPEVQGSPNYSQLESIMYDELISITNSDFSDCDKCKYRLTLGKSLALTNPELVPTIFTKWCLETDYMSKKKCLTNFSRNTVTNSSAGTNFADMLSLMDVASLDASYYCYYKEGVCDKPETPEIDISYMWPEKQDKYKVAPEPGSETFNVLHISDFHIELDYTIGSEKNCTDNMCCTPHSSAKHKVPTGYNYTSFLTSDEIDGFSSYNNSRYENGTYIKGQYIDVFSDQEVWEPASTFGSYECDAPEILINNSLVSIQQFQEENNITFDFSIFTGDLVDHDEIAYTGYEMTVQSEEIIFRDVKNVLQNIPVYSVMGNHDTFPYGEIAQEKYGFSNLFDWNAELMSELWYDYDWIDFETAQEVKQHYTGFSVTTKRGLKIITLNTNVWYVKNHYAYINITGDPDSFGQFQFLVDELVDAEEKDQRVWILFHIPAATGFLPTCSNIFAKVVERFSPYTIAAIFNGHTHQDEFQLLYSSNGTDADAKDIESLINFAWIMPAVTPYVDNNPAWRYYEVDSKTFSIMEAHTYYTKLNETFYNHGEEPVWEYEYSARSAYNISYPSTSPLNATYWHLVAEQMKTSNSTLQTYMDFNTRHSPYTPDCLEKGNCDTLWCYVTSFTVDQYDNCLEANGLFESD